MPDHNLDAQDQHNSADNAVGFPVHLVGWPPEKTHCILMFDHLRWIIGQEPEKKAN
jgi:hypothetical protein